MDNGNFFAPISDKEFKEEFLSKRFLHLKNDGNTNIFPKYHWHSFNEILNRKRFDQGRVRMVKDGQDFSQDEIFIGRTDKKNPEHTIQYLNTFAVNRLLTQGATLIVNAVEELDPFIADLANSLEHLVKERVQANLYACFEKGKGFDLHWDDHDVVVVQLQGVKKWKVYDVPLTSEKEACTQETLWEGILEEGEILYLPRGYAHKAISLGLTVHVTFGFSNRRVEHYLKWLLNQLSGHSLLNADLNSIKGSESVKAMFSNLSNLLQDNFSKESLVNYLQCTDARLPERPYFNFPYTVPGFTLPENLKLQWNAPLLRKSALQMDDDTICFEALKRRWKFSLRAQPLIIALMENTEITVVDLIQRANIGLNETEVREFLKNLLNVGLIKIKGQTENN